MLDRVRILLKARLKRHLSFQDLLVFSAGLISKPIGYEKLTETITSKWSDGTTLLDHWRSGFQQRLERIAQEETWILQRQRCVLYMLQESEWLAIYAAANPKNDIPLLADAWSHYVRDTWPDRSQEHLPLLLVQRWIHALLTLGNLGEVAAQLFKIDTHKRLEIDLYYAFYEDVIGIDVNIRSLILKIPQENYEQAFKTAKSKALDIDPLLAETRKYLADTSDRIVNDTFDIYEFKDKADHFDARRKAIAEEFTSAPLEMTTAGRAG
ncbi:hypothetical protein [Microvirga sp. M2]|uniref:hypothetical protein n=1 Tax=Microvirga sp. M2 TaxID=3073270 RepID=UPI0039C07A8C